MSLLVDRGDGDEEAIARIEPKSSGRDHRMSIAGRNRNALAIEVLVHGAGRDNNVVDVAILDLIEFDLDSLQRVARDVEAPWRYGCARQTPSDGSHYLRNAGGVGGSNELDLVVGRMLVRGDEAHVFAKGRNVGGRRTGQRSAATVVDGRGRTLKGFHEADGGVSIVE